MKILKGNKLIEISKNDLISMLKDVNSVCVDLGTGDGRFVYKTALANPNTFYTGLDPAHKQMEVYSKKALRSKLANVLYVVGSVEQLPTELFGIADQVQILFPWGALLGLVVSLDPVITTAIKNLLKPQGTLSLTFGYSLETEPNEFSRLQLPEVNATYINSQLIPFYKSHGFDLQENRQLTKQEIKNIQSSWSKKLAFGKDRPIFYLSFSLV